MKRRRIAPPAVVLGLESSTPHGGVAIATPEGDLLAQRQFLCATGYSRRLMPTIDGMLKELEMSRGAIQAIAGTRGPGAFTGVRIGLATAKTLAWSLNVPLYLFSTLECLALRARAEGIVSVLIDARRGEIYSGVYDIKSPERMNSAREASVEPVSELIDFLCETGSQKIWLTGDGVATYRAEILEGLGERGMEVQPPWNRPAADIVALEGARSLRAGREGLDPMKALPEYLRRSDAERNLTANSS